MAGVYLAENMNALLAYNWQSFAGQNYFDAHGVFVSVLWSGPLLVVAVIILVRFFHPCFLFQFGVFFPYCFPISCIQVNTLFSTCQLMVRWKRAELRHRARLAREKAEWYLGRLQLGETSSFSWFSQIRFSYQFWQPWRERYFNS